MHAEARTSPRSMQRPHDVQIKPPLPQKWLNEGNKSPLTKTHNRNVPRTLQGGVSMQSPISNPKCISRRQNNDAKTTLSGPTKQRDDSSDKPPPFSLGRPPRQKKNRCCRLKLHKRISSAVTCVCRVLQKNISRRRNYNQKMFQQHPFLKRIHDRQIKLSPHTKKKQHCSRGT